MRSGLKGKENNMKNNSSKIVIKDKTKFITFIAIILVVIIVGICIAVSNSKIKIDENTNISELNVKKYSEEIKAQYEQEGKNSKFVEDWDSIQDAVAMYLIENYPADNTQVSLLIEEINAVLKSDNWEKFGITKPTMWNGSWQSNENGNVAFKFAVKEIEPSWANTLSDQGYIILN